MSFASDQQHEIELTHRAEIERLFADFEVAVEPQSIFSVQSQLVQAISAAEPVAFRDKTSPHRDHLRRLRLIGDGLAWRLLHPYSIRQLAKNQGGAQAVSTQAGFTATLRLAEQLAQQGHPVVVCDLTNCLRVGDVVLCSDPERPVILESGGHPQFQHKGRKARQRRRAQAITELLESGSAHLFGDSVPTETIEIGNSPDYSWTSVERVVLQALLEGESWMQHDRGDAVYASRAESEEVQLPEGLEEALNEFEQVMAALVTMLQKPNPRVPPVTAWPISPVARLALLQSDVFLLHAIDLGAFCGAAAGGELVGVKTRGQGVTGFTVRAAGVTHHVAPRFLDDVMLGFQTIESTRAEMVALGAAAVASGPEGPVAESDLVSVESVEEA